MEEGAANWRTAQEINTRKQIAGMEDKAAVREMDREKRKTVEDINGQLLQAIPAIPQLIQSLGSTEAVRQHFFRVFDSKMALQRGSPERDAVVKFYMENVEPELSAVDTNAMLQDYGPQQPSAMQPALIRTSPTR